MNHPNVIKLYDVIQAPFKCELLMELAENGELFEYIVKKGKLNENEAKKMFK
jgi:5'-AMP-activated protein kinase catalytic alpha subunit